MFIAAVRLREKQLSRGKSSPDTGESTVGQDPLYKHFKSLLIQHLQIPHCQSKSIVEPQTKEQIVYVYLPLVEGISKLQGRDFPGCPVVKTSPASARGRFDPA